MEWGFARCLSSGWGSFGWVLSNPHWSFPPYKPRMWGEKRCQLTCPPVVLVQHFWDVNAHTNQWEMSIKYKLNLVSLGEAGFLRWCWCCWSVDHTLSSRRGVPSLEDSPVLPAFKYRRFRNKLNQQALIRWVVCIWCLGAHVWTHSSGAKRSLGH